MGILEKLRGRKSASELGEALQEISSEIADTQSRIKSRQVDLRAALFDASPTEVQKICQDIRDAEEHLATLAISQEAAQPRYDAAVKAATEEGLEGTRNAAIAKRSELRAASVEYDKHLAALTLVGAQMRELSASIAQSNAILVTAGYEHLRVRAPLFQNDLALSPQLGALKSLSLTTSFEALEAGGKL